MTKILVRQETTLVLVILVIGAFASSRSHLFLSQSNLTEILRSSVIYFVMACGAALLIIGGGLDFSAGAVFTLGALSTCKLLVEGVPWPPAILIGMAICCAFGAVNFLVITYLHVPPIIATLGTFYMLTGLNNLVTSGNDIIPLPQSFQRIAQGSVAGLSSDVVIAVAVGVLFWFVLERTHSSQRPRPRRQPSGRGRERTASAPARLGALRDRRRDGRARGVIYSAQVGAGQVTAGGTSTTLNAITAVLIGGVSLMGGMGNIQGIAVGAVLLSLIDNALVLTSIPPQYNSIVVGAILVGAVAVDHLRRARIYRKR
ncbi:ABC transporter permease [Streptomyces malaysiensis subsp. malaysiensis]